MQMTYWGWGFNFLSSILLSIPCVIQHEYFLNCMYVCLYVCIGFLGPQVQHMEVPRLRVESKLQLPAYAAATVPLDLSSICNLHHSSQQRQISNPLSAARD